LSSASRSTSPATYLGTLASNGNHFMATAVPPNSTLISFHLILLGAFKVEANIILSVVFCLAEAGIQLTFFTAGYFT
jgi:heme/copper-type cytochrome/quinol oxidase subunit 4